MRWRHLSLVFVIGSLFLVLASPYASTAETGKTIKLSVPNLPRGV